MNNEQQELLDEVYKNYCDGNPDAEKTFQYEGHNIETRRMTKEEFIDMVKTDEEYGRRWGLKIEERELSLEERRTLILKDDPYGIQPITDWTESQLEDCKLVLDEANIPTRLITVTYKDKTIESYE